MLFSIAAPLFRIAMFASLTAVCFCKFFLFFKIIVVVVFVALIISPPFFYIFFFLFW